MSDKSREWWLSDVFTQDHGEVLAAFFHHKNIKGSIHVIEAAPALARIKELEGLNRRNELALEGMLTFSQHQTAEITRLKQQLEKCKSQRNGMIDLAYESGTNQSYINELDAELDEIK